MKAVTHRPRDLADIEAVIDANPILDRRYLRRWLRESSAALEIPEIAGDVERMLKRQRKPGH